MKSKTTPTPEPHFLPTEPKDHWGLFRKEPCQFHPKGFRSLWRVELDATFDFLPETSIRSHTKDPGVFAAVTPEMESEACHCIRDEDLQETEAGVFVKRSGLVRYFQALIHICPEAAGAAREAVRLLLIPWPPMPADSVVPETQPEPTLPTPLPGKIASDRSTYWNPCATPKQTVWRELKGRLLPTMLSTVWATNGETILRKVFSLRATDAERFIHFMNPEFRSPIDDLPPAMIAQCIEAIPPMEYLDEFDGWRELSRRGLIYFFEAIKTRCPQCRAPAEESIAALLNDPFQVGLK